MKKSDITKKKIFDYIEQNPGTSNTKIADFLGLSSVAVLYHLQDLLKINKIYKIGNTRSTRYFVKKIEKDIYNKKEIFKHLQKKLSEEFEGIENINFEDLLENLVAILLANGTWKYGLDGFVEKIRKENNGENPDKKLLFERLYSFFISFFEEERKRRKNGFFDGTESLKIIMKSYNVSTFIDKLLFTQIATLPHFGRLRGATELFYGKQDQNKYLIEKSIMRGIDLVLDFIKKNNINNIIFTPPTLKRKVQFRDVLKEILLEENVFFKEIKCEKIKSDMIHTLRPQKELKGFDRIINAQKTIIVENFLIEKIDKILIFDDNFTTGSTINFIAEKLIKNGYKGKIIAITITGNFEYIPGITDVGEI